MMRILFSTTHSNANFSSRHPATAAKRTAFEHGEASPLNARTATCIATAVLLGSAVFAGKALGASADDGASDAVFKYSQVEADPLAPVATVATSDDHGTAKNTPPEFDGIRTIEIDMAPGAFNAKAIEVYKGETVRFVLRNTSPMSHDFTIGTKAMQDFRRRFLSRVALEDLAARDRDLLDNWNAVVVLAGETRELVWTFEKTEKIEFGSNLHGQYEAGMKGRFTTIATEETITAETDAPAEPVTIASAAVVAAPSAPAKLAPAAKVEEADPLTTAEPLVAPAPPAPPAAPAFETSAAETAAPETPSPESQTTIITPAAVTSATETPATLEPGLDIMSPNISAAEFASLINSAAEMPATETVEQATAEPKAKPVKTAALGSSITDALDQGRDTATPKTVAFSSGTLPDNGLDYPAVRRDALVRTARANIDAEPMTDAQSDPLSSKFVASNPIPAPGELSLQELARQQSSLYEAEPQTPAATVPAPRARPASNQPLTAAAPIPKPGSRMAALSAEGLNDVSYGTTERVTATPIRKNFVALSIQDHMRMGKMREQALLSRSLERRALANLTPEGPIQLTPTQLSVPVKRQPEVTITNFSSAPYGGSAGKYRGEINDKGERGALFQSLPPEVEAIRRISDTTIRKLDDAGSALLRTAGSLIKRVGLDDVSTIADDGPAIAVTPRPRPALVEEYGSGEFGESKK